MNELPSVKDNSVINDMRLPGEFTNNTFSNFKKLQVKNEMEKCMLNGKLEPACFWCCELICSGHFSEIWETILHFIGKYIHIANPKLCIYIEKRFLLFKSIISNEDFVNELHLRNHPSIRKIFAEVISILTYSNKKHSYEPVKINKKEEYDITQMTERLIAPNIHYIDDIFQKEDPKELFVAMNEFSYNLSTEKRNFRNACYWIEWVIEFEIICKKKKMPCVCEPRPFVKLDTKFRTQPIWIIWDILFHHVSLKTNSFFLQVMQSLFSLFCIKYTHGTPKRRRFLLYFAVSIITEECDLTTDMIQNKKNIQNVLTNINKLYREIKKKEITPTTDYLFANLEQEANFENSLRKLQLVQSMDVL